MGYYDVVKPCVVGQLHYARPTAQPIKVDDEVAAPLVEDGSLRPYPPVSDPASKVVSEADELPTEESAPAHHRRSSRRPQVSGG